MFRLPRSRPVPAIGRYASGPYSSTRAIRKRRPLNACGNATSGSTRAREDNAWASSAASPLDCIRLTSTPPAVPRQTTDKVTVPVPPPEPRLPECRSRRASSRRNSRSTSAGRSASTSPCASAGCPEAAGGPPDEDTDCPRTLAGVPSLSRRLGRGGPQPGPAPCTLAEVLCPPPDGGGASAVCGQTASLACKTLPLPGGHAEKASNCSGQLAMSSR